MFFARTLSWLGFFPRLTSVTCFRTFLHLCSCSTFSPSKAPCRKHTFSTVTALWLATFRDYPWSLYFVENFCKWRTNSSSLDTSGIMDSTWYGEGEHFVRHAFWCGEIQCSDWRLRSGGGMKKKCALLYAVPSNRISEGLWAYRIIDCGAVKDIYRETKEST